MTDLQTQIDEINLKLNQFIKPGRYIFDKPVQFKQGSLFAGSVSSSGSALYLPLGWSSAKDATGQFTVTHNLGTAMYAVVVNAIGLDTYPCSAVKNTNSFQINVSNLSVGENVDSTFILMLL